MLAGPSTSMTVRAGMPRMPASASGSSWVAYSTWRPAVASAGMVTVPGPHCANRCWSGRNDPRTGPVSESQRISTGLVRP